MGTEISHDVRGERGGGGEDFFNIDLSRKGYSRGEKIPFVYEEGGGGGGGRRGELLQCQVVYKEVRKGREIHTVKDKGGGGGGNLLRRQVVCKLVPVGTEITYG